MKNGAELARLIEYGISKFIESGHAKSKAEIARTLGVSPPSISDWEREGKISREHFFSLAHLLRNTISPDQWFDDSEKTELFEQMCLAVDKQELNMDEVIHLEVLTAPGCCSDELDSEMGFCEGKVFWSKPRGWFRSNGLSPEKIIALRIEGNLLSDFVKHQDIAIFDESQTEPKPGNIYLFSTPKGWVVRMVGSTVQDFPTAAGGSLEKIPKYFNAIGKLVYREGFL